MSEKLFIYLKYLLNLVLKLYNILKYYLTSYLKNIYQIFFIQNILNYLNYPKEPNYLNNFIQNIKNYRITQFMIQVTENVFDLNYLKLIETGTKTELKVY